MRGLAEFSVASLRIILGIFALVLVLAAIDLVIYITVTGTSYDEKITAGYDSGYREGYTQTYQDGYHDAYADAYERGYTKGYETGLQAAGFGVATRVELRNPTYQEMKEFLAQDKTDDNLYVTGEYVSLDFAVDLNNSAERQGLRAAFVTVIFPEKSHGIVAFETVDRGLVFIEPQSDGEVSVVVGESYWRAARGFVPTQYADTIVEVQLLW